MFDDIEATDLFLKRERLHAAQLYQKRYNYKFRERSIDDGSHYDPRLDKYSYNYSSPRNLERTEHRIERKIGGFEKVYALGSLIWKFAKLYIVILGKNLRIFTETSNNICYFQIQKSTK